MVHSHYVELMRDLMKYFDSGVAGITKNSKGLFEFTIQSISNLLKTNTDKGASIFTSVSNKKPIVLHGKELDDIIAVLRLQK